MNYALALTTRMREPRTKKIGMMLAIANGINYFSISFKRIQKESYKKLPKRLVFEAEKN